MERIISKPRRRAAVAVIGLAIFIIFLLIFDFWQYSKNQQTAILIGATVILIIGMLYLTIKTNIGKFVFGYGKKENLDEREVMIQLGTYQQSFRLLDFIFSLIMVFIYLYDDLKVDYPELGWKLIVLAYLLMRLLPIMIIAWTEEEI